mgnify:CR=1 FL=1
MTGWIREYLANKEEYLKIFDGAMQQEQEQNVEFLENSITKITGRKYAVACSNGTDALHFALISLGIKPGDEVLTTQFSWISTASCISMVGATPVFCEINILNYHMDLDSIKRMYSSKVKAIVYPHLFGNMSDTKEIIDFCKEKNIAFIEDAAQSLGFSLNGVQAGSIGDISTLSFNANKVVAGEQSQYKICLLILEQQLQNNPHKKLRTELIHHQFQEHLLQQVSTEEPRYQPLLIQQSLLH